MNSSNTTTSGKAGGFGRPAPWIAVASGKGGTGKTSVAVSLARAALRAGRRVQLVDADVEGPNAHHFLGLGEPETFPVEAMLPRIDPARCTLCGECAAFCIYQALAVLGDRVMVFPDMCHGCEGCRVVCPAQAIENGSQEIGRIMHWRGEGFEVWQGRLHVGQVLSPILIRELHRRARESAPGYDLTIVDSPPGTSCPMMAAVRGANRLVLVTEPTPFGLHDLELAMAAVRRMKLPVEVIVNRSIGDDAAIDDLCRSRAVPVIARFPEDRAVAAAYAEGRPMIEAGADWAQQYDDLRRHLEGPC